MIPRTFRTIRMRAITIRVWIQLPVFGKRGLMFPPKKPSSHRITRITMIVHNMRFLLFERFALDSSYNKHSPAASIDWGGFVSAILPAQDIFDYAFTSLRFGNWLNPCKHIAMDSWCEKIRQSAESHGDASQGGFRNFGSPVSRLARFWIYSPIA